MRTAVTAELEDAATDELDVAAMEELEALEEEDTELDDAVTEEELATEELEAFEDEDTELDDATTEEELATEELETTLEDVPVKQFETRTSHKVAPVPKVPCTAACTLAAGITTTLV